MKYWVGLLLVVFTMGGLQAQTYRDSILQFRDKYTKDLLAEPRHPIKPADARYLRFYEPDASYAVWATFTPTPGKVPILVPTHSGKDKPFKEYGYFEFAIHDTSLVLHVYQSVNLIAGQASNNELFIPFNDYTNYDETFGGGRYIDLSTDDIKDGRVLLDFNKCYNPYCAYAEGFSCPIPPDENKLIFEIKAGEKLFGRYTGQ